MKKLLVLLFILISHQASAFEMMGMIGYDTPLYSNKPARYESSGGGIGYGFFGRLDLGAGAVETGFLYAPTSLTWTVASSQVTANGSYWLFPVMYRVDVLPPFLNFAIGPDFAYMGNTSYSIAGASVGSNASGFKSHFGAQASIQGTQDLGENLSAVLDIRYRQAIGNAIAVSGQSAQFNFFMISLGLQKRLE
jgi:hypothetical protein